METQQIVEYNYRMKLDEVRKLLDSWSWRLLSIIGKIQVINDVLIIHQVIVPHLNRLWRHVWVFLAEMSLGRLGFFSRCFHGVNFYCDFISVVLCEVCFAIF